MKGESVQVNEFQTFIVQVSRQLTSTKGNIGQLMLTENMSPVCSRIREPEARYAVALECEKQKRSFGVEVPTKLKYRFTKIAGTRQVAGRHDLVLFDDKGERDVLLELKEGQIHQRNDACPKIEKDLIKLAREPDAPGACMFHILNRFGGNSLETILEKYRVAWCNAISPASNIFSRWFCFIIFVKPPNGNSPFVFIKSVNSMAGLEADTFFVSDSFSKNGLV